MEFLDCFKKLDLAAKNLIDNRNEHAKDLNNYWNYVLKEVEASKTKIGPSFLVSPKLRRKPNSALQGIISSKENDENVPNQEKVEKRGRDAAQKALQALTATKHQYSLKMKLRRPTDFEEKPPKKRKIIDVSEQLIPNSSSSGLEHKKNSEIVKDNCHKNKKTSIKNSSEKLRKNRKINRIEKRSSKEEISDLEKKSEKFNNPTNHLTAATTRSHAKGNSPPLEKTSDRKFNNPTNHLTAATTRSHAKGNSPPLEKTSEKFNNPTNHLTAATTRSHAKGNSPPLEKTSEKVNNPTNSATATRSLVKDIVGMLEAKQSEQKLTPFKKATNKFFTKELLSQSSTPKIKRKLLTEKQSNIQETKATDETKVLKKENITLLKNQNERKSRISSYDMTPHRLEREPEPLKDEENYDIENLLADDSEDEENPRKQLPLWARKPQRNSMLKLQSYISDDVICSFFVCPSKTPDLRKIFGKYTRERVRTSSAIWKTPPINRKK